MACISTWIIWIITFLHQRRSVGSSRLSCHIFAPRRSVGAPRLSRHVSVPKASWGWRVFHVSFFLHQRRSVGDPCPAVLKTRSLQSRRWRPHRPRRTSRRMWSIGRSQVTRLGWLPWFLHLRLQSLLMKKRGQGSHARQEASLHGDSDVPATDRRDSICCQGRQYLYWLSPFFCSMMFRWCFLSIDE